MYQIKQKPEDFIVTEIPKYALSENGEYSYFWLTKTDYNTVDAAKKIASMLNTPIKNIGFAGAKDKVAVTKQVISLPARLKDKASQIKTKDLSLEFIGDGNSPISLGDLKGNDFYIVVRNLDSKRLEIKENIPNYFGPQRFSENNSEIGKLILKKEFKKAVDLVDDREAKEHLSSSPWDYVGALRKIPLKTRKIYIHAYQSELWNKTAKAYLETHPHKNMKIPIIGFNTELDMLDNDLKNMILEVMKEEEITQRDFIIPQIKELSAEGDLRDLFIRPGDLNVTMKEDELNKGKFKAIVSFTLPKGSYATTVIEEMFSQG